MRATGASVTISAPKPRAAARHRLGDRAHASEDVSVEALQLVLAAREQVEEEPERRPRRVRPAVLSVDVVREEERLDLLALVVAVQEVAEASRQERDHPRDLARPRFRGTASRRGCASRIPAPSARADLGRRLEEERLEVARQALELVVDADERARVRRGEPLRAPAPSCRGRTTRARRSPSGNGTSSAGSHGTIRKPVAAPGRGRGSPPGRSMLAMYDVVDARQPGAISSVTQAPPTTPRRSTTSVAEPGAGEVRGGGQAVVPRADRPWRRRTFGQLNDRKSYTRIQLREKANTLAFAVNYSIEVT